MATKASFSGFRSSSVLSSTSYVLGLMASYVLIVSWESQAG